MSREEKLILNSNDLGVAKITYKKFEKVILDFQMKSHEKFLGRFLDCFKQVDNDNNGIIDEVFYSEFYQVYQVEFKDLIIILDNNITLTDY